MLRGLAAAAAGTLAMDVAQYVQFRAGGGDQGFLDWETSSGLDSWEDAPAPAQVGRRIVEGLTGRQLSPARARLCNNVMHWLYGSSAGVPLALVTGTTRLPAAAAGPPFGAGVWLGSYAVLGSMGLYKPIWQYSPSVLAKDLGNHLIYGTATGLALSALTRR